MFMQIIAILTIGPCWSKIMLKLPIPFGEKKNLLYFCTAIGILPFFGISTEVRNISQVALRR